MLYSKKIMQNLVNWVAEWGIYVFNLTPLPLIFPIYLPVWIRICQSLAYGSNLGPDPQHWLNHLHKRSRRSRSWWPTWTTSSWISWRPSSPRTLTARASSACCLKVPVTADILTKELESQSEFSMLLEGNSRHPSQGPRQSEWVQHAACK